MAVKTHVRLFHRTVTREYYGSHGGSATIEHGRRTSAGQAIREGEKMTLTCEGCGDTFAFRLLPEAERRQYFRRMLKRRIVTLAISIAVVALGGYCLQASSLTLLKAAGITLIAIGDATILAMLANLAFRSRAPRYDFELEPPTSFRASVQHGVELLP